MSKHNPGPWFTVSNLDNFSIEITDANNLRIAFVDSRRDGANARLISAAPLMYEALCNLENDDGLRMPASVWKSVVDAVLAAGGPDKTVKATGGDHE